MSDGNAYAPDSYQPPVAPPPKNNTGLIVAIVAAVVAVPMMIACLGVLVALLLPAVQAAREASRRMQCSNNLKQIGLALHNYESTYKSFPPAFTVDASGRKLHSWRTLILPFMEQQALYAQIDLDKPWDDPANLPLGETLVPQYACPSAPLSPASTTYVAVVDPSGIFSGPQATKMQSISDGLSNTLLVTETDAAHAVPWMSPEDIDLPTFVNAGADRSTHSGGHHVGLADGAVQFLSANADPQLREATVTKAAGDGGGIR